MTLRPRAASAQLGAIAPRFPAPRGFIIGSSSRMTLRASSVAGVIEMNRPS